MEFSLKKELPIIAVVLLPFIYLAVIWNTLPETVPIHWNAQGEIDGYGSRESLWLIPIMLPLFVYVLFLIIPKLDPRNKISQMGNKYYSLKFILTLMMSLLAVFIIYSSKNATISNFNYIVIGVGLLFAILGNYFKTIKPNYFIGIRTPWTLENETVWKDTHKLGGKIWFIGGLVMIVAGLLFNQEHSFNILMVATIILSVVHILYSYLRFKKVSMES